MTNDNIQVAEFEKDIEKMGWVFGLEAVSALAREMDINFDIPVVHVAGTNGKGSVCMMLASVFKEAELNFGLFVSPAVFDPLEVIQVSGEKIAKEEYDELMLEAKAACDRVVEQGISHPTAFEVKTVVAFKYFSKKNCQVIILETGLGGTEDATNFIEKNICSVITEIGMDHMDILGESIEDIAAAKAGIIKKGCPVVCGVKDERASRIIKKRARELNAEFYHIDDIFVKSALQDMEINQRVGIQKRNAKTASLAADITLRRITDLDEGRISSKIRGGIHNAKIPGRFETILSDPEVIIDGGHNIQAVSAIYETIKAEKWIFVIGMLKDKEYEKVLDLMCPLAETVYTVTVPNDRAVKGSELKAEVLKRNARAICFEDKDGIEKAVRAAIGEAKEKELKVLVFGSFYYLSKVVDAVKHMEG